MIVLCDHQTGYLPWLGVFHRVSLSDIYVSLDTVKYHKSSYDDRNCIKTPEGAQWLKVPTHKGESDLLKDITINHDIRWQEQHLKAVESAYGGTPFFERYFTALRDIINKRHTHLMDLNDELFRFFLDELGIKVRYMRASSLPVTGTGNAYLIGLCEHLGAKAYLFGQFGLQYADIELWKRHGISVAFHAYTHPQYRQKFKDFTPYLSVIDLLFNEGPQEGRRIIMEGQITRVQMLKQIGGQE